MRLYLSSFRVGAAHEELIQLVGSKRRTAVILNAVDYKTEEDRAISWDIERGDLEGIGLEPHELDLREFFGQKERLSRTLSDYDAVWVRGGNTFILRRAFHLSGFDSLVRDLLVRDAAVYGGYSAGVAVLTPTLTGLEIVDDPYVVPAGYTEPILWDGLGVIPYEVVPHNNSDHVSYPKILELLSEYQNKEVRFVALRDGEAILHTREGERIVGRPISYG